MRVGGMLGVLLVVGSTAAAAQSQQSLSSGSPRTTVSVASGMLLVDGGEERSAFVAVRGSRAFSERLLAEATLGGSSYGSVTADGRDANGQPVGVRSIRVPLAIAEGHVHALLARGAFRPYVGFGGGMIARLRSVYGGAGAGVEPTVSTAVGAFADLGDQFGLRGDVRLRADGINDGVSGGEVTLAATWRW